MQKEHFTIDIQTLYDLNIFADSDNSESIYKMLDFTVTPGGKDKYRHMFRQPLNNKREIQEIQEAVLFFKENKAFRELPVDSRMIDTLEVYFFDKTSPITSENKLTTFFETLALRFRAWKNARNIIAGAKGTLHFIRTVRKYISGMEQFPMPEKIRKIVEEFNDITESKIFGNVWNKEINKLSVFELLSFDKKFRETYKSQITLFFENLYEIDKLISMAEANIKYNLVTPELSNTDTNIEIKGLYHVFLKEPVKNDLVITDQNLMFLTGPNMAGKTTLLKSLGVIVCLAHTGLGVPAEVCKMPVYNGLFSSVNTTDNLFKGYSYFYSEVLRVKHAAEFLKVTKGNALLIFDELFKGTNIKDAFDCSLTVIDGLVKWKQSTFIISSHLLELGNSIEKYPNVTYRCFDSKIENNKPRFTYKLKEGLSDERLGLLILQSENIEKLLDPDN